MNPRISVHNIPGHVRLGKEIAAILDGFLHRHPKLRQIILGSIGVAKDACEPIPDDLLLVARQLVAERLGVELSTDPGLTELCAPCFFSEGVRP